MTTTAEKIKVMQAMECWVNVYPVNVYPPDKISGAYTTPEGAKSFCAEGGRVTHFRQVTPQDEQDRKDAARYRYLKTTTTSGVLYWDNRWWLEGESTEEWDELIDKAMEGE